MDPKRFLFVFGEGGGNVPPQLGLARKLVARGHEVRVLTEPCVEDDVRAIGASYASFTKAPHRRDRSREADFVRDYEARTPLGSLAAFRDRMIFGPARALAEDTLSEIERWHPDVLAPDWLRTGAAVAGEAAGVPTALLVHGSNLLPEPGKPPAGFGFLPATNALDRLRDRVFERGFLYLFNKGLPALNDARRACGLEPIGHVVEHFQRAARFLCLYSEAFELPAKSRAPNLRFVGPVLEDPAWTEPWDPPWLEDDRRPLVVISMSTTFMNHERAIQRSIDAVSAMPVLALVTVGPTLEPGSFRGAGNVAIVKSAPHGQVFNHAAAVVTHAGMGTVSRALASGLPLVCMPTGRDQSDIAARVEWHGAGVRVGRHASAADLKEAIERVLGDLAFRHAAEGLRDEIQADIEADRAIAEVEALAEEHNVDDTLRARSRGLSGRRDAASDRAIAEEAGHD